MVHNILIECAVPGSVKETQLQRPVTTCLSLPRVGYTITSASDKFLKFVLLY